MEIVLDHIGLIEHSSLSLNGLTVITGMNNSGKTTVGKALYSLIDAVSDLSENAEADRIQYIYSQLENAAESISCLRFYSPSVISLEKIKNSSLSKYPLLVSLLTNDYKRNIAEKDITDFAFNLHQELLSINTAELCADKDVPFMKRRYIGIGKDRTNSDSEIEDILTKQLDTAATILAEMFDALSGDPHLIDYTRERINQTLNIEFSGQIQPVNFDVECSKIELFDGTTCCFQVEIADNTVINKNMPVYYTSPYKRTIFIDDPFVLDNTSSLIISKTSYSMNHDSALRINGIKQHKQKLRIMLRKPVSSSVLEQTLRNLYLDRTKKKIDEIIPGSFEFSSNGNYYVQNGRKLRIENLATGSKMFSILKILLKNGYLDSQTMLILDEPEAHLHPQWQNQFAEMIVLLVKELKVNILLTSHSSNFVLALDAYMRKYGIEEKTSFYKTEATENGYVNYTCLDDDLNLIYQDFLQYFSEAKVLRDRYLRKDGD